MALASDGSAALRWDAFLFWGVALALLFFAVRGSKIRFRAYDRTGWWGLGAVLVVVGALRLLFLDSYPLVIVGDAVRDGGLHPQRFLASAGDLNPFGLGPYHVLHNILSFYSAAFQRIAPGPFGMQLASVTLALGEAALLYRLAWRWLGVRGALFAGLLLATWPLHLAFARNDPSLMLGSFWTALLLERGDAWLRRRDDRSLLALGLVAGLGANLHWTVRAVGIWVLCLVGIDLAVRVYRRKLPRAEAGRTFAVLVGAAVVGFGPSFLFADLYFADARYALAAVLQRYGNSLVAYLGFPLGGYVFSGHPLVTPLLVLPFLVALAACFLPRSPPPARALGLLLMLVPLTNSAGASALLSDSFLLPLVPIAALAIAFGLVEAFRRADMRYARGLAALTAVAALAGAGSFFVREPLLMPHASGMTPPMLFAYGNALRAVRQSPALANSKKLCFGVSQRLERALRLVHWRENLDFSLPGQRVEVQVVPNALEGDIYLSTACPPDRNLVAWQAERPCDTRQRFVCPREPAAITLYVSP